MKPFKYFFIALLITVAAVFFATSQGFAARLKCGDRTSLLKLLSDKYKEKPRALGLSTTGNVMFEVYTSQAGTWTITMTTKTGITCIMAAGDSWQEAPRVVGDPT